jgi:hypothetical protein
MFWVRKGKQITLLYILRLRPGAGAQQVTVDNAFLLPNPEGLLTTKVKNFDLVDSATTNPFQFHDYGM